MFQAPPELPAIGTTTYSSSSSEKITKSFSSSSKETFSSDMQGISLPALQSPPMQMPAQLYQNPAPAQQYQSFPPQKQQQQAPQQTFPPKQAPQSFVPKPAAQSFSPKPQAQSYSPNQAAQTFPPKQVPVQVVKQMPYQNASPPTAVAQSTKISSPGDSMLNQPRSGLNASPVTPGIHKKHVQLNAAVPVPPYNGTNGNNSKSPVQFMNPKSPVPFLNTTPTPFGYPPVVGTISTPESVAQTPIKLDPLVPKYSAQKPLPLIVSTPIPHYDNNYNLAARGWGVCPDYYRPVILTEQAGKKLIPPQVYTDF